eukprot:gene11310-17806_t
MSPYAPGRCRLILRRPARTGGAAPAGGMMVVGSAMSQHRRRLPRGTRVLVGAGSRGASDSPQHARGAGVYRPHTLRVRRIDTPPHRPGAASLVSGPRRV